MGRSLSLLSQFAQPAVRAGVEGREFRHGDNRAAELTVLGRTGLAPAMHSSAPCPAEDRSMGKTRARVQKTLRIAAVATSYKNQERVTLHAKSTKFNHVATPFGSPLRSQVLSLTTEPSTPASGAECCGVTSVSAVLFKTSGPFKSFSGVR